MAYVGGEERGEGVCGRGWRELVDLGRASIGRCEVSIYNGLILWQEREGIMRAESEFDEDGGEDAGGEC